MSSINVKPTLKLDTSQNMPPPSNSDNPRPILKVNTKSRQSSFSGDVGTPTPSGEIRKIKIKLNSQPNTPAATAGNQTPSMTKSKAGRMSKPTAKLIEARKRPHDDSDDEDQPLSSRHDSARPDKKIKVTSKQVRSSISINTPVSSIKFKPRGELVEHRPGDAYDSEASDREADPHRETTFILRVLDGSPVEYLKKALAEGTIGQSKQNGGADFGVQFLDGKQRRAMVTIDGKYYAAALVALPTITEAMKSWDRKNMMKNSDLTEMLLCFAEVRNEAEAKSVPLPPMVAKYDNKWPHGITPPMHDAIHRRFRKTISEKQWQSSAEVVAKLLEDDAAATETIVEYLQDDDMDMYSDDEEDAEGEAEQDYFGDHAGVPMEEDDDEDDEMLAAMEAELAEERLQEEEEPVVATPAVKLEAQTPLPMADDMDTPVGVAEEISEEDDDDDEEEEDDEDDDEEMDDEQLAAERERKEKTAELEHLKRQYEDTKRQLTEVTAPILKKRLLTTKTSLEKEISIKKAALGLTDED